MHIEITPETLLTQLGYPINDAMILQAERAIAATAGFDVFGKHILSLKDELAHYDGYIALSNSRDLLKIKSDSNNPQTIDAYLELLQKWSDKYKIKLENVEGTNTHYILGQYS